MCVEALQRGCESEQIGRMGNQPGRGKGGGREGGYGTLGGLQNS